MLWRKLVVRDRRPSRLEALVMVMDELLKPSEPIEASVLCTLFSRSSTTRFDVGWRW